MQQAQVSGQAGVDQAEPGLLAVLADAGQCHLDPGGAGSSPKPGSVQPQGEDQPDGPVDDDVLPFAELAGGDLETEAAARSAASPSKDAMTEG